MTDPRSPSDDDLVLAAFDGNANNDARAPLSPSVSPSVQADIEGLRAVRALLNDDAAWGEHSGTDVPPAHLLDAIVRAEVAARSDVVRQAMASASSPAAAPSAWQRLSSWLVGGGVLVGATAAVLLTVQRAPAIQAEAQAAPTASAIAQGASAPLAPAPPPPPAPPAPAPAPVSTTIAAAPTEAVAEPVPDAKDTLGFAATATRAKEEARAEVRTAEVAGLGAVDNAMKGARRAADGPAMRGDTASSVDGFADADEQQAAPATAPARKADAPMFAMEAEADDGLGLATKAPMTAAAPAAPTPPPAEPAPAASGNEVRRLFRERMAEKKTEARKEAKDKAKKAPSADSLVRDRQLQEANGTLLTAERELQQGRFGSALDLALRAEATSGGALGLAPVATQARALRGLGRPADAAQLGKRLLEANPADPQLMAGVVAAAASAFDVGDRQLCRRLSQLALQKPNADEKLRAEAKRLLALVAQPGTTRPAAAAPAKP